MESGCDIRWERVFLSSSVCVCYWKVTQQLCCHLSPSRCTSNERIHGGRLSSYITCSGYKVSQHLGKFQVSACLANTSWKSLGDRPLTKPDRRLTGKMPKAYRCKDTRSHCGSVLCVSTRWIWISALLSMCLSTLFSVLLNWTGLIVCQRHKVWFRVKPSYV